MNNSSMKLRSPSLNDLDFILTQEHRAEFKTLINRWSRQEHEHQLSNPDKQYWIAETDAGEAIGYAILSGLQSPHNNLCLTRIVIAQPGQGYGKVVLKQIIQKAFEVYQAHRLWLDVVEHNLRAQQVYRSLGFQPEGVLREAHKLDDRYVSLIIMSILEQDYRQLPLASSPNHQD
ncbi:MAG TPA: GNAT family protein [Coleofasciculaceae cyanobacterium]